MPRRAVIAGVAIRRELGIDPQIPGRRDRGGSPSREEPRAPAAGDRSGPPEPAAVSTARRGRRPPPRLPRGGDAAACPLGHRPLPRGAAPCATVLAGRRPCRALLASAGRDAAAVPHGSHGCRDPRRRDRGRGPPGAGGSGRDGRAGPAVRCGGPGGAILDGPDRSGKARRYGRMSQARVAERFRVETMVSETEKLLLAP